VTDTTKAGVLSGVSVARLSPLHWAMILTAAASFGVTFLFLKTALVDVPPMSLAALRCVVAIPFAWVALKLLGGSMPRFRDSWPVFSILGLLTAALPFPAIAYGQGQIETALTGMLFGALPVFNVLLVPLIARDEAFHPVRLFGALFGFCGLLLVMAPKYTGTLDNNLFAMLLIVFAAISYAAGVSFARREKRAHPIAMIVGQLIWGSIFLVPLALYVDWPWQGMPSLKSWGGVLGVGILGTAVAPIFLFLLVRMIGGTRVSIVPLLMPIFATMIGVFYVGEQIHMLSFMGLGCVLGGAIIIARSPQRDI
jgi:drug/metabolite transporter (DMT)-like permease